MLSTFTCILYRLQLPSLAGGDRWRLFSTRLS